MTSLEPCLTGPSGDATSTGLYLPSWSGVSAAVQPLGETLEQSIDYSLNFVSGAVNEGVDVATGAVKYGLVTAGSGVDTAGGIFKDVFAATMSMLQGVGIVSIIVAMFLYWMYSRGHLGEYTEALYSLIPMPKKKGKGAAAMCGACM